MVERPPRGWGRGGAGGGGGSCCRSPGRTNGAAKLGWRLELHLLAAEPLVALLALEHLLDLALEVLLDLLHCGTVIRLPRLKLGLI